MKPIKLLIVPISLILAGCGSSKFMANSSSEYDDMYFVASDRRVAPPATLPQSSEYTRPTEKPVQRPDGQQAKRQSSVNGQSDLWGGDLPNTSASANNTEDDGVDYYKPNYSASQNHPSNYGRSLESYSSGYRNRNMYDDFDLSPGWTVRPTFGHAMSPWGNRTAWSLGVAYGSAANFGWGPSWGYSPYGFNHWDPFYSPGFGYGYGFNNGWGMHPGFYGSAWGNPYWNSFGNPMWGGNWYGGPHWSAWGNPYWGPGWGGNAWAVSREPQKGVSNSWSGGTNQTTSRGPVPSLGSLPNDQRLPDGRPANYNGAAANPNYAQPSGEGGGRPVVGGGNTAGENQWRRSGDMRPATVVDLNSPNNGGRPNVPVVTDGKLNVSATPDGRGETFTPGEYYARPSTETRRISDDRYSRSVNPDRGIIFDNGGTRNGSQFNNERRSFGNDWGGGSGSRSTGGSFGSFSGGGGGGGGGATGNHGGGGGGR